MGDYKVLHTFSPSFEAWGEPLHPQDRHDGQHHRVLYLAMVEYERTRERDVYAFDSEGTVLSVDMAGPCERALPGWLVCEGHPASK